MKNPPVVFFSYSHKDESLRDKLDIHLSSLRREGLIEGWHDRKILPGADWATEIDQNLAHADIIVLMVSANFIASDYCWSIELNKALERHARGEAIVIPVIVRPVDWEGTPIGQLQALPRDARPVSRWSSQDEAWTDVARGIRSVIHEYLRSPAERRQAVGVNARMPDLRSIEFAHITVPQDAGSQWMEDRHRKAHCHFGKGCERYFHLKDFVYNADLFFDVTILNKSSSPVVLSAVGVEIGEVVDIAYVYGMPTPAKIPQSGDRYEIAMPELRSLIRPLLRGDSSDCKVIDQRMSKRLVDPIYLPSRSPYRYVLQLRHYQQNIPNHARLRLTVEAQGALAKSQLLHVFTW